MSSAASFIISRFLFGHRKRGEMDTYYVSHGSPTLSIDESLEARHFFKGWRNTVLAERPKAILMVSGHWDTDRPEVNVISGRNETIYDFYGFPKPMYQIKYPAPGAPETAKKVKELLTDAGFGPVKEDKSRGLDHGAWVPLYLMYPEADIPVCQLSVQSGKDAAYHYNLGRALSSLRDDGVLIIGSGSATHNLREIYPTNTASPRWAVDFDKWLRDALISGRHDDIKNIYSACPDTKKAHPWPDHLYPLQVALGAAGEAAKAEQIHHSWSNGTLSYASYRFSAAN